MVAAVLAIILTLILVVGIHEAGHGLVARFFAIKIQKISIGFGKSLLSWTNSKDCEWVWAMWPLGGYVQLLNTRISPVTEKDYPQCFDKRPIWQRLLVLVSGSLANIVTAWLAFILIFFVGLNLKSPDIASVVPNSLAYQAGFQAQDQWVAINGTPTPSWQEVGMQLIMFWGQKEVQVTLRQPNGHLRTSLLNLSDLKFSEKDKSLLTRLGINPNLQAPVKRIAAPSFIGAIKDATLSVGHWTYFFLMVLKQVLTGVIPFSVLLGPLGLFAASIVSFTQGILIFLYFIASLSIAVGLVNLFPVPGLDGGSILYTLIEKCRGKPMSVAMEVLLYRLVQIAFALLLVQLILNDLQRFYA
ncbi:MAG: peptidase [Legionella sp.]|nr:MAG: peptidase [Legionella sp.]